MTQKYHREECKPVKAPSIIGWNNYNSKFSHSQYFRRILAGHSEKSLCYLLLSIHTHTHVTLFCVSFPGLSLSSSPRYLTLRTYLLYFISRVTYMCAYYSITCLCKNCHFIHFVNTSFKGCTPFTTVFVLYFS